jgi:predicted PurR-regulated permease PerM
MAQETLKITITADNQQAVQNIQQTVTATTQLGNAFKTLPNTSNQATNALTNLSRVAQDAPYGFIGIANNLNPLLESFQRLKTEAGSTSGALKAMAGGLMGPAGIGLALGAVSSIIVAFGPKIADFIKGTNKASEAEDKFAKSLSDARSQATETGIKLQAYLTISESANVSEEKRAEAFKAVIAELSKVNSTYASTITTVDQARKAVDLYTQSLVAQAIAARYIDEIATKTIALNEANKKILQTGRDYYTNLENQKNAYQGVTGVAIGYQLAISNAKDANKEARAEAIALKNGIIGLNSELLNTLSIDTKNPFQNFGKAVKEQRTAVVGLSQDIKEMIYEYEHSVHPTRAQRRKATPLMRTFIDAPAAKQNVSDKNPAFLNAYLAQQTIKSKDALKAYNQQLQLAGTITDTITPAFEAMFQAMANGENIGKALEESFKQIIAQLTIMIIKGLIFKAVMSALGIPTIGGGGGGFTNFSPIGSSNEGGSFVLRGQDLLLATNRAQKASNLKGQNISLA